MSILIMRTYAAYHWPRFYRHRVADPGLSVRRNTYGTRTGSVHPRGEGVYEISHGTAWIGLALVVGRYAYCVKWARAETEIKEDQ